jgi:hypothetical protein
VAAWAWSIKRKTLASIASSLSIQRAIDLEKRGDHREAAAVDLAFGSLHEAEFGNSGPAKLEASEAVSLSSGKNAKTFAALAFARAGDISRAQTLADELNKGFPSDTMLQKYWLPNIRALIELSHKDLTGALATLRTVSYELGDQGPDVSLYPAYNRGEVYLAAHQGREAEIEFQKLLDHRSIVLNSPLGALASLGLARAYVAQAGYAVPGGARPDSLGSPAPSSPTHDNLKAKARAAYQDFFALWKDADPDIPILKQAKAEYAKVR